MVIYIQYIYTQREADYYDTEHDNNDDNRHRDKYASHNTNNNRKDRNSHTHNVNSKHVRVCWGAQALFTAEQVAAGDIF